VNVSRAKSGYILLLIVFEILLALYRLLLRSWQGLINQFLRPFGGKTPAVL
jgi:hypothetical protein